MERLLNLEFTTICYANCVMCPRNVVKEQGYIDEKTIDNVLEFAKQQQLFEISISGRGEPTLHPNADSLLKRIHKLNVPLSIVTTTDGMNEENYKKIIDNIDILIRSRVGFEKNKNSFKRIKDNFIKKANKENSIIRLTRLYFITKKELKKVEIDKPKKCLKVGIIGELYTSMEPFSNYELEKLLASFNIEIKRFTNLSYLLWQKRLKEWYMKLKIKKYCKYTLGADGLDNVYRVYWLKKHKYDGIIHIKPTGCTPEIGAMPIIMNIAKDNNMPIIFLSFDEQTGVEGLNTRIEAFYDLLKFKKEEENGSISRN